MSENVEKQLRGDEGEVLTAYQDSLGFWTIGIGRLIDKRKGGGITKEESSYLFQNDLKKVEADLDKHLPWWRKLDEARRGVLINMRFQLGMAGLLGFKNTLAMIERGEYASAAKGMLQSKWANQTPKRAYRLSEQMRTATWQYS